MVEDRPIWRSRAWPAVLVVLLGLTVPLTTVGVDGAVATWVVATGVIVTMVVTVARALVATRRQRRSYEAELARWAADRARQEERLRIAADLHDLVSHGLGLITVRAAAARATSSGDGGDRALADIERVSRETTTELRRMLTVLRIPGTAPLRPADTLADLPAIIDGARGSGLDVAVSAGDLGAVSAGAQLTVCAVVREALHNVLRHAGPTTASVEVTREPAGVVVRVADGGPAGAWAPNRGAGHGLETLRARVAAMGGEVEAAPEGNGFVVVARIPDDAGTDR